MKLKFVALVAVALLAVTAQPAAAANASAVASEHTTFGTGSQGEASPTQLTNAVVAESGESASVVFGSQSDYNPVDDDGSGSTDDVMILAGDATNNNPITAGLKIQPDSSGALESLSVDIAGVSGNDYGVAVDIYLVQESEPDSTYQEGTLIKSGWDPDFTTGPQTISLDTQPIVSADTSYTLEFVSDSSNSDGTGDVIRIASDSSASTTWYRNQFNAESHYTDVTATIFAAPQDGTYVGAQHDAGGVSQGWTNLTLQNVDATLTWQEDGDGDGTWSNVTSTTVSTTTNVTQDLSGTTSDQWRLRVDVTATGSDPSAEIHDEGLLFESSGPILSDSGPPDGSNITNYGGDVSIAVSDGDFPLAQSDTVTVTAKNESGDVIGSQAISSDGRVSFQYPVEAGTNEIKWTATDEYGNSDSFNQSFTTPAAVSIVSIQNQSTLVTNANVTVRLYESGDRTVVERKVTNGKIDLSELSPTATYVVRVEADGYKTRSTLLQGIFEQSKIYMLDANTTSNVIEFDISDRTGDFGPQSELQIERPVNKSGSTNKKFVVVAGDRIGSQTRAIFELESGVRYRIRISTADRTQSRQLGAFVPQANRIVTLKIGQLQFRVPEQGTSVYNVSSLTLTDQNGTVTDVRFNYADPTDNTTQINVSVETLGGTVINTFNDSGTFGNYAVTQPVTKSVAENHTFVVKYEITRGGSTITGQTRPGLNRYTPGIPLAGGLKQWFSVGLLLMVGGLFSAKNARVGSVITPLFAAGFWYFDWLPAETSIIAIALAIGIGVTYNFGGRP
jgi:hypothetical protein